MVPLLVTSAVTDEPLAAWFTPIAKADANAGEVTVAMPVPGPWVTTALACAPTSIVPLLSSDTLAGPAGVFVRNTVAFAEVTAVSTVPPRLVLWRVPVPWMRTVLAAPTAVANCDTP